MQIKMSTDENQAGDPQEVFAAYVLEMRKALVVLRGFIEKGLKVDSLDKDALTIGYFIGSIGGHGHAATKLNPKLTSYITEVNATAFPEAFRLCEVVENQAVSAQRKLDPVNKYDKEVFRKKMDDFLPDPHAKTREKTAKLASAVMEKIKNDLDLDDSPAAAADKKSRKFDA